MLAGVRPGMPAYEEELFGPAAAVVSRDVERAERIAADRLDAGCCFVNALVQERPRLPFGGVKESGHGRELGRFGIQEFLNVKRCG